MSNFGENIGPYHYIFEKSEYYGQYQDGRREGLGIIINNKEGFTYEGQWKNDKIDGYGTMITDERDWFFGNFSDGNFILFLFY